MVRLFADRFQIVGLGAGKNVSLLDKQVKEFKPKLIFFQGTGNKETILASFSPPASFLSLEEIASHPEVDLVVVATSGKIGLAPTLAALRS